MRLKISLSREYYTMDMEFKKKWSRALIGCSARQLYATDTRLVMVDSTKFLKYKQNLFENYI
jgi:hypothetical protein